VEPHPRVPRVPRPAQPKGEHGGFANALVGGQKDDAQLQRAVSRDLLQRGGRQGPASQLLAVTWGVEAQEQSCDTSVSECLASPPSEKRYLRSDPAKCSEMGRSGAQCDPGPPLIGYLAHDEETVPESLLVAIELDVSSPLQWLPATVQQGLFR
jgi:hypothetical protein